MYIIFVFLSHIAYVTAGPVLPDRSSENLLRALFNRLEEQPLTKRCPLIWRLYLRFLYDHGSEGASKTAFYRAIEECPWVKVNVKYLKLCTKLGVNVKECIDAVPAEKNASITSFLSNYNNLQ